MGDVKAGGAWVEIGGRDAALDRVLKGARKKVKQFAEGIGQFGKRAVGASALLLAPIVAGVKASADFELGLTRVGNLLDDLTAKKFLPQFESQISDLAISANQSTDILTDGLFDIISAGVPVSKAMNVLTASAKAATGGFTDVATATSATLTILEAYKSRALDATQATDFLLTVAKKGRTDFGPIAAVIGQAATSAAVAGLSLEEFGAVLATITRGGISTSEAITQVKGIINGFSKPTDQAKKAAKKFGLELNTTTLRTIGLVGAVEKLTKGGATPEDIAAIFPNITAKAGIDILSNDIVGLRDDIDSLSNSTGITERNFANVAKTLKFALGQAGKIVGVVFKEIGDIFREDIKEIGPIILNILRQTREWIRANKDAVKAYAKIAIVIGTIGVAAITTSVSLKALLFLLSPAGVIASAVLGLLILLDTFGIIDTGFKELTDSIKIEGLGLGAFLETVFIEIAKSIRGTFDKVILASLRLARTFGVLTQKEFEFAKAGLEFEAEKRFDDLEKRAERIRQNKRFADLRAKGEGLLGKGKGPKRQGVGTSAVPPAIPSVQLQPSQSIGTFSSRLAARQIGANAIAANSLIELKNILSELKKANNKPDPSVLE